MYRLLLYTGIPIARVDLDAAEPALGVLEPLPAYEALAAPFRRGCDTLWLTGFGRREPSGEAAHYLASAEAHKAALGLADEDGTPVPTALIDVWDSTLDGDPPFVLVYFGEEGAGVPARLRGPQPAEGAEGSRPAA